MNLVWNDLVATKSPNEKKKKKKKKKLGNHQVVPHNLGSKIFFLT